MTARDAKSMFGAMRAADTMHRRKQAMFGANNYHYRTLPPLPTSYEELHDRLSKSQPICAFCGKRHFFNGDCPGDR